MKTRVIVLGHLNVDYVRTTGNPHDPPRRLRLPGGTAYNAGLAFMQEGFSVIVVGRVGDDAPGHFLLGEIERRNIQSFIEIDSQRPTGARELLYDAVGKQKDRGLFVDETANDYGAGFPQRALGQIGATSGDLVFLPTHTFARFDVEEAIQFVSEITRYNTPLIVDVLPHTLYRHVDASYVERVLSDHVRVLIAELRTMCGLFLSTKASWDTLETVVRAVGYALRPRFVVLRFGRANISEEAAWQCDEEETPVLIEPARDTGYAGLRSHELKRGYGDRLAAAFVRRNLNAIL